MEEEDLEVVDLSFMEEGDIEYILMFFHIGVLSDEAYKAAKSTYNSEWPEDPIPTIPLVSGSTPTRGKRIRDLTDAANEKNREKISKVMHKGAKLKVFKIGDVVGVKIPGIDKHAVDSPYVISKVVEIPGDNQYRLWCHSGVLSSCFPARELQPMPSSVARTWEGKGRTWESAAKVPTLATAARNQSQATKDAYTKKGCRCSSASKCKSSSCPCRAAGLNCGSHCHKAMKGACANRNTFRQ